MSESLTLANAGNAYAPTADEREEVNHLSVKPAIIKFDGATGRFINTKVEGDEGVATLTGIILGHRGGDLTGKNGGGQVLFGEALLGKDRADELGVGAKWVCRNHDQATMTPQLNDTLAPEVLNAARAAGAGKSCAQCKMRQFGDNNERPKCAHKLNLIWLGDDNKLYLVQFGGKSITAINRLLQQFKEAKVATFCCKVTLKSEQQKSGAMKWREVRGDIDSQNLFPLEQFQALREMRKAVVEQYASHVSAAEEAQDDKVTPESDPTAVILGHQEGFGAEDIGLDDVPF